MSTYSKPVAGIPLARIGAMLRGGSVIQIVDALWVPTVSALLIVAAGLAGHWMKQPWLFAGIGPTAFLLASAPGQETSRFKNVVVGHLAAIGCAYLALLILNASGAPSVLVAAKVSLPRVWASALALGMLALVQPQLKAYHPPAAATLLLITLGAYRMTGRTPLALMAGVVLVTVVAELLNRLRPSRGR
jgi:hypothetical protein